MSSSTTAPVGHVVHLLHYWGDATPPESLRLKSRLSMGSRAALWVALLAASALGSYLLIALWTSLTPGWWFNLIFTVMIGCFVIGGWVVFADALRSGVRREAASARWSETNGVARATEAIVTERDVVTSDSGDVPSFTLTVKTGDGQTVTAQWRPQPHSRRWLLQSQIPGVGSRARVWQAENAGPLVIEVLDATVGADVGPADVPKYAG